MAAELKRMAELLKSGASMLKETCPECGTPLFRVGNETICPKCNRQVIIVKTTEEEARLVGGQILESVEQTLLGKIQEVNVAMRNETDPEKLIQQGNVLTGWLGALEKIRRLKSS